MMLLLLLLLNITPKESFDKSALSDAFRATA